MLHFLTVVLLVAVAAADETPAVVDKKYNCSLAFVSHHFELEDAFKVSHSGDLNHEYDSNECDSFFDEIRNKGYADVTKLYSSDGRYAGQVDCIVNKLKEFNLGDLEVLKYVYLHDTKMPKILRADAVWEVEHVIGQKRETAGELCLPALHFGRWFDAWYGTHDVNATTSTEVEEYDVMESLKEAYCWRQHLVSSNFSGIANYNVTVNPKNIDEVSDDKCEKYWQYLDNFIALEDQFLSSVKSYTGQQKDCVTTAIKNGQTIEMVHKASLLGESKLGEDVKIHERKVFVEQMTHVYAKVMACFS